MRRQDSLEKEIMLGMVGESDSTEWIKQQQQQQYLPPLSLIINYHDEYPSDDPPSFILSCFYFSTIDLENLCQKIDNFSFIPGEVCVYDWIELIKQEITNKFIIHSNFEEQQNNPRALNEEVFRNRLQSCSICTDIIPGIDCIRLHHCGLFYCRTCLNHYIRMILDNGKFGENLLCPQDHCKQALLPIEIK
ncbi:unnamed protein product [Rotaria sp. Silwood1]|nr:unnamed protein product [Rotaria sp. Silwood1]